MRGDQAARDWRPIRAIGAISNGLTVGEIAKWEETGIQAIYLRLKGPRRPGFPCLVGGPTAGVSSTPQIQNSFPPIFLKT
jgi:hypothetical protein